MSVESRAPAIDHPLVSLSADEIERAAAVLRQEGRLGETVRVHGMLLVEPDKEAVLAHPNGGGQLNRNVLVVLRDRARRETYEAVVSVTDGSVVSWRHLPDVQPPITGGESLVCEEAIKADPQWQEALRRRGVEDLSLAVVDPWAPGYQGPDEDPGRRRTAFGLTWVKKGAGDNCYGRPVEGLVVRFDLDEMRVVDVEDHGAVPLPPKTGNFTPDSLNDPDNVPYIAGGVRPEPKPLDIVQKDGPDFTVTGNLVQWQRWRLRVGFSQRDGLVLHQLEYQDQARWRPVLYRASISEIFNPYGDPAPTHYRKNAFDGGEYWIGACTNSLELGCDCLGEIRYLDGVIADDAGAPSVIENAICMHEEDAGILWKHFDYRSGRAEVRRSRRFVISSVCTVGNYDYAFYWHLYQDGTIEFEAKLSGIISNGALPEGKFPTHGTMVAPNLYGPNHQHFFSMRLDMMVDGLRNSVHEVNAVPDAPGPENTNGTAWRAVSTPLRTESEAQRNLDLSSGRYWRVLNPNIKNALGGPVAYKLLPGESSVSHFHPGAHGLTRGGFIAKHLWVTAFAPDELYGAGAYPNQRRGSDGLPEYVKANRDLENQDLVVWYTFGIQHVVRPEDWPVMPVHHAGFKLKPEGFFDSNPAVDLPPPAECAHNGATATQN
ncbi:MAG: primary-amine oxidase [Candidatus Dormibacteraeota bacterium]|nr:primary-amine oxidase [Candidatus Dormibacteraeota bacterium]